MKKLLLAILLTTVFSGCDSGSFNNSNPFLPNYPVNIQINLNLPQYSVLQFPGNNLIISGEGIAGVVIFNSGSGYLAFDLACPNQSINDCTQGIQIANATSINGTCPCDDAVYSLYNGTSPGKQYPLKAYRTQLSGTFLSVTN